MTCKNADDSGVHMTAREAADRIGVSVSAVYRWGKEQRDGFPATERFEGRCYFDADAIEALAQRRKTPAERLRERARQAEMRLKQYRRERKLRYVLPANA